MASDKWFEREITGNLRELAASVRRKLRMQAEREALAGEIAAIQNNFLEVLEPLVDDAMFDLVILGEDMSAKSTRAINELLEGGVRNLERLLVINAEINLACSPKQRVYPTMLLSAGCSNDSTSQPCA